MFRVVKYFHHHTPRELKCSEQKCIFCDIQPWLYVRITWGTVKYKNKKTKNQKIKISKNKSKEAKKRFDRHQRCLTEV